MNEYEIKEIIITIYIYISIYICIYWTGLLQNEVLPFCLSNMFNKDSLQNATTVSSVCRRLINLLTLRKREKGNESHDFLYLNKLSINDVKSKKMIKEVNM